MSGEMRQELNGVKRAVGALATEMAGVRADISALQTDVSVLKSDVSVLKLTTHNIAVAVAGHKQEFDQIKQQLTKLGEFEGIKKCLEVFTSEILASRHERTLMGKGFFDQQATLTDHELRLTRIELRGKQS